MTLDLVIYATIALCMILYLLAMGIGNIISYLEKRKRIRKVEGGQHGKRS